jgi:hypothetical protein
MLVTTGTIVLTLLAAVLLFISAILIGLRGTAGHDDDNDSDQDL